MKNLTTRIAKTKAIAFLFMTFVLAGSALSQTDTIHLNYYNTSTKLSDTTSKKIDQWVKKIAGKHMDISVLAYYNKSDFKQFAQERADELFLVINRKARDLITIEFIGPKKGENYQRSRVDIVYRPTGSLTTEQAKELAEKTRKEEEEKAKKEAKAKKDTEKKEVATEKPEKEKKEKKEIKSSDTDKKENKEEAADVKKKDKKEKKEKPSDGVKKEDVTDVKKKDKKEDKKDEDNNEDKKKDSGPKMKQAGAGQWIKDNDLEEIKRSKIIITTDALAAAMKNYWSFTSDVTTMSYADARAYAKEHDSTLVLSVGDVRSESLPKKSALPGMKKTIVSYGTYILLENKKGNVVASSCISTGAKDEILPEALAFGIASLNYQLKVMDEKHLKSNLKIKPLYKEHSEELKLKTLYIPEIYLSEKFDRNEIPEIYKAKYEIVSYDTWKDAILSKKDVAYVFVVPSPVGGEYTYIHYLVDAQTGMVYSYTHPKGAVMSFEGINLSKANTGYINKRNIEQYYNSIKGDW